MDILIQIILFLIFAIGIPFAAYFLFIKDGGFIKKIMDSIPGSNMDTSNPS